MDAPTIGAHNAPLTDQNETAVSFDGTCLEVISRLIPFRIRLVFRNDFSTSELAANEIDALNPVLSELTSELLALYAESDSKE